MDKIKIKVTSHITYFNLIIINNNYRLSTFIRILRVQINIHLSLAGSFCEKISVEPWF